MNVILRNTMNLTDDDEVVNHMGAGDVAHLVNTAIDGYPRYAGLLPGRPDGGAFVMSTFAAVDGVSEQDILAAMRHRRFATAKFRELRDLEIYPTSMDVDYLPPRIMQVHFDIVLPDGGWIPPTGWQLGLPGSLPNELVDTLSAHGQPILNHFTPLPPREGSDKRDKYPDLTERP